MINVYENDPQENEYFESGDIIARVQSNTRLDFWDGNNWTSGATGLHKGITKLRKPANPEKPYVIIITSQWQGFQPYAYCVDAKTAVNEILKSGNEREDWVWPELKKMIDDLIDSEE